MKISSVLTILTNYLLDVRCILCLRSTNLPISLCINCSEDLPQLIDPCRLCAEPLPTARHELCGRCLQSPPPYDQLYIPYIYSDVMSFLITQLKFRRQLIPANALGFLLGQFLSGIYQTLTKPDFIIPIPLHALRLKERGFNQALEIARPVSRSMNIPLSVMSTSRQKNTLPQSGLSGKDRSKNLKQAFNVSPMLQNKYVAVIDDVMTTGQTLHSFCQALKSQGVAKIDVWVVAKTLKNN